MFSCVAGALKPSLVEWKRNIKDHEKPPKNTLNPSLVEWKHSPPSAERISGSALKPS